MTGAGQRDVQHCCPDGCGQTDVDPDRPAVAGAPMPITGLRPVLDVLCPMHLLLSPCGRVIHAGPTLDKLRPGNNLSGQALLDLFEVTRPRAIDGHAALFKLQGSTLRLVFRTPPRTTFKACIVPFGDGAVLNLSFGISIMDAVRDYALSSGDFAATDMTVEIVVSIDKPLTIMVPIREKPTMTTKAYSYLRISTDQQKVGDGVRRQMETSKAYADLHGYELVDEMRDIGVSAFKGKNASEGALGLFIAALDAGKIDSGSVLLVENLDRLSRNTVLEAFGQFTNILNKGIAIVNLTDGQHYTAASVNENMGQLFMSMGAMLRAYEESALKSKRVGAAWKKKRENIQDKILTKVIPSWLKLSVDEKSILVDEQKANIVLDIYKLSADGMGAYSITQHLNTDPKKYPHIVEEGRPWQLGYVQNILTNPATYGTFQPHHYVDGKRVPVGDPVADYFPAIVTKETFDLIQARRKKRRMGRGGGPGRKGTVVSNIFTGLLVCGSCGGKVTARRRYKPDKTSVPYLRCSTSADKQGCNCGGWYYHDFEDAFVRFVREIKFSDVFADEDATSQSQNLEAQKVGKLAKVTELEFKLNSLLKQFEAGDLPASLRARLIDRTLEHEADIAKAKTELIALNQELANLNTSAAAEEQADFLAKYDELVKTQDQVKLRAIRFALPIAFISDRMREPQSQ